MNQIAVRIPLLKRLAIALAVVTALLPGPSHAISNAGVWQETYYGDSNLSVPCGSRTVTGDYVFRDSSAGWAPPVGCPPAQGTWSAVIEQQNVFFSGTNYEFGLFYDFGARLYIDDQLVVDGWSATQHYESRDILPGNHLVRIEYKNNAGPAVLQAWWRGAGALPRDSEPQDPNQWFVNYWGNPNQWQDSVGRQNEGGGFLHKNYGQNSPGLGVPSDYFSLKFERTVTFTCGAYQFRAISDDGYRLSIDGITVKDRWFSAGADDLIDVALTSGAHAIKVDYVDRTGAANIDVSWTLTGPCAETVQDLRLAKQASSETVSPGQTVQFTVTATANQNGTMSVVDQLAPGLDYVASSATNGATFDATRRALIYSTPALRDSAYTFSYRARVASTLTAGAVLPTLARAALLTDTAEALLTLVVPADAFGGALLLVYAGGDSNLSAQMMALINGAERSINEANVKVIVLLDGPGANDARVYQLHQDVNPVCPSYANALCNGAYVEGRDTWAWSDDTASVSSLTEFVGSSLSRFPNAQRLYVSIVGHGEGFSPDPLLGQPTRIGQGGKPGGLLEDLHPLHSLSTSELALGLKLGLQNSQRRIDLLFLDACMMASLETLYELRDSTALVLASQSWSWSALPYDDYVGDTNAQLSAQQVGERWLSRAASSAAEYALPYTFSLVDLSKIAAVSGALDQLSLAVSATLPASRTAIVTVFDSAEAVDSNQDGLIAADDDMRDLRGIATGLKARFPNTVIETRATTLIGAIDAAVLRNAVEKGIPGEYSTQLWQWRSLGGISAFAPGGIDSWKRRYYVGEQIALAADTHWDELVSALHLDAAPSAVACTQGDPTGCLSAAPSPIPDIAMDARGGTESVLLNWRVTGNLTGYTRLDLERAPAGSDNFVVVASNVSNHYADRQAGPVGAATDYCYRVRVAFASGETRVGSNTACALLGKLGLWVPQQVAPPATMDVLVPVNVENGDGVCASGISVALSYDPAVAEPTGAISNTIYSSGYRFNISIATPGQMRVTHFGACTPLYGPGTLFTIAFRVYGVAGASTPLRFIAGIGNTEIVDQRDAGRALPLHLLDGALSVKSNFGRGDVNGDGAISIADASSTIQIASGAVMPLAEQLAACDVTGDGRCDIADGSVIACRVREGIWDRCVSPPIMVTTTMAAQGGVVAGPRVCASNVVAGNDVTATVMVQDASGIAGANLSVLFDPDRYAFVDAVLASSDIVIAAQNKRAGVVRLALSAPPVSQPRATLAHLHFRLVVPPASTTGQPAIVSAELSDAYGRDLAQSALQRAVAIGGCTAWTEYSLHLPVMVR